ncbi:hypothetical protein D7231_33505 [Streptomyces klenkii]|uniref:Uncharacterized protein n=2 Tax=Streptomyces klenkii TaxID=1420899 RepID=A0A3B0AM40_9ACTN|nr:hypothetical protein D7231_33505 [Streptomyces klenkii]
MLAHLRKNETFAQVKAASRVSEPVAQRYLNDTLELLAVRSTGSRKTVVGLGEGSSSLLTGC